MPSVGPQQFPTLIAPPTSLPDSYFAPALSPSVTGGIPLTNPSVVPSAGAVFRLPPAGGPTRSASGGTSNARSLVKQATSFPIVLLMAVVVTAVLSMPL